MANELLPELRRALRSLSRSPRTSLLAITTLALGIGATTAIFSVVHAVLLRPLPFPEPDRIAQIFQVFEDSGRGQFSHPNFADVVERNRSFESMAQYASTVTSVVGGDQPARVRVARVSREFFDVLGVQPLLGRGFVEEELRPGGRRAALVGYGYWQRYLGGERDLSSLELSIARERHDVVGVLPASVQFPRETAIWIPRELEAPLTSRTAHNWSVFGRLTPDVGLDEARQDLSGIARELRATLGEDTWMVDAAVVPLHRELVGSVRPALLVLVGSVGLLLFVACANVVNLLLGRAESRRRELAVCAALGASRWDRTRPFLLESLVLSLTGGALGLVLAVWGVRALLALEPGNLPRADGVGVSVPMLLFALAVSILTALSLGLVAGLRSTGRELERTLRESQRGQGGGRSGAAAQRLLVVSQVALTLILLTGAGLLGRSLFELLSVDPGFRTESLVAMELAQPRPRTPEDRVELARLQGEILERLRALPVVSRAGGIDRLPMSAGFRNGMFLVMKPGESITTFEEFGRWMQDPERASEAEYRAASEDYFETMGVPLIRGRTFDERDHGDSPHVAVISESLASTRWAGRDPIGELLEFGNMDGDLRLLRVVGVVGDVRHGGLHTAARPTIYTNVRQRPAASYTIVMETSHPAGVVTAARDVVRGLAPDVPPRFQSMEDVFTGSLAQRRFNLLLLSVFAAAAMGLAVMGIYGVVSQAVSRRQEELGIRVALGAVGSDVVQLVLGQGMRTVAVGIVAGLAAAAGLSQFLESLLFEVSALDPLTFFGLAVALSLVALAACYLPARRAAGADPMRVLRSE